MIFWVLVIIGIAWFMHYYMAHNTGVAHSTTDYKLSRRYFGEYPYTLYHLKNLTMAMNDLYGSGVSTIPTKEEIDSLNSEQTQLFWKFYRTLSALVIATLDEHHIEGTQSNVAKVRTTICDDLTKFKQCYPNWPRSYEFAKNAFWDDADKMDSYVRGIVLDYSGVIKYYSLDKMSPYAGI